MFDGTEAMQMNDQFNTSIKQKHIIYCLSNCVFDKSLNIYLKYIFALFDLRENGYVSDFFVWEVPVP